MVSHSSHFDLIGFSDVDFAGEKNHGKSTSRTFQILGSLISWHSKKQTFVPLPTTE